jgi:hypothetical protein
MSLAAVNDGDLSVLAQVQRSNERIVYSVLPSQIENSTRIRGIAANFLWEDRVPAGDPSGRDLAMPRLFVDLLKHRSCIVPLAEKPINPGDLSRYKQPRARKPRRCLQSRGGFPPGWNGFPSSF